MTIDESEPRKLTYPGEIRKFILDGYSTFTIRDTRTSWVDFQVMVESPTEYVVSTWVDDGTQRVAKLLGSLIQNPDGIWIFEPKGPIVSAQARIFERFWQLLEEGCRIDPHVEFRPFEA